MTKFKYLGIALTALLLIVVSGTAYAHDTHEIDDHNHHSKFHHHHSDLADHVDADSPSDISVTNLKLPGNTETLATNSPTSKVVTSQIRAFLSNLMLLMDVEGGTCSICWCNPSSHAAMPCGASCPTSHTCDNV